jgi:hypothetical protein
MSYVPNNLTVFTTAYSGVISGFAASGRRILDPTVADYNPYAMIAGAFAQSFDTQWAISPDVAPDTLQVFIIEKACKAVWENRDTALNTETLSPASYTALSKAIIALVIASENYFASQSITPNPWPSGSGTVTEVEAGAGISVTGPAATPTVANTGVLELTAGSGIAITGTNADLTITNTAPSTFPEAENVTPGVSGGPGDAVPANAALYLRITIASVQYWVPAFTVGS